MTNRPPDPWVLLRSYQILGFLLLASMVAGISALAWWAL